MQTGSPWHETRLRSFRRLNTSGRFDVVVVGGGITGLTSAYLLKSLGKRVCLLERDRIVSGDSGRTTAHLTHVTDLRLTKLVKTFGRDQARLAWRAGEAAIDTVEEIIRRESIECDFQRVPGFLHAAIHGAKGESAVLRKEALLANELGFAASFVSAVPLFDKPGIRFANQATFHPMKYLAALARIIDGDGSVVREHSEVDKIEDEGRLVEANRHRLLCDWLVIATHVPLQGATRLATAALFQTKLFPYSSYAIGAKIRKGLVPLASYWDTSDPYYYLRVDRRSSFDYVIFGGEDHKTGQVSDTQERFNRLEQVLREFIPDAKVDHHWSGQVVQTADGLPFIGKTSERQVVATGFSGNGITFGTVAGMMACDTVLQRQNPWNELFRPNRKKIRGAAWDYIQENSDFPYYFLEDRITAADAKSPRDVKRGEGKILRVDGQRVACRRADEGTVTQVSAVCTHMGCIVHWNAAETTWDCPCHGSRFKATGEVIAGPAETPLESIRRRSAKKKKTGAGDMKSART